MENSPISNSSPSPTPAPSTPSFMGGQTPLPVPPHTQPVPPSEEPIPASTQDAKTKKQQRRALWAFLALVLIVLVVGGTAVYWYYQNLRGFPLDSMVNSAASPSPLVSPEVEMPSVTDTASPAPIALTQTFTDPDGLYQFKYPSSYTLDAAGGPAVVRVYKIGPTQIGQTEMYDGVVVTYELIELAGQTMDQWAKAQITTAPSEATSSATMKATTINGFPAISYTTSGVGSSPAWVIQKDGTSQQVVRVTMLVADPTNAGFENQAQAILNSTQLLK